MSDAHIELTDATFSDQVEKSTGVVVVDFWAPWCGPCQMLDPILNEVAKEFAKDDNVTMAKLMVDDNPVATEKYQVSSIPTIALFTNGQLFDQISGVKPKDVFVSKIKAAQAAL